jgi:hypothetical protein
MGLPSQKNIVIGKLLKSEQNLDLIESKNIIDSKNVSSMQGISSQANKDI